MQKKHYVVRMNTGDNARYAKENEKGKEEKGGRKEEEKHS